MEEKISVIVPVYMVEKHLDKCIESIVNQTYKNLEILLIDDGSTDNCPAICDQWEEKDSRIKVYHKKNGGLSNAKNFGVKHSSGEYITFIDSDDTVAPNMIEYLYKILIEDNSDISIIKVFPVKEGESFFENTDMVIKGSSDVILTHIVYYDCRWESVGKLYKRNLFQGIHFWEGKLFEDMHFTPIIFSKAKTAVLSDSCLYDYLIRDDSIMGNARKKMSLDILEVVESNLSFIKKHYKTDKEIYSKLFAGFVVNPCTKLEAIENLNSYKINSEFLKDYKKFLFHHKSEIFKNRYLQKKYKLGLLISFVSVRTYNKIFKIVRFLQNKKVIYWSWKNRHHTSQ